MIVLRTKLLCLAWLVFGKSKGKIVILEINNKTY